MNSSSGYRRTPNSECVICKKPLYRRPFELKKVRYVACMKHRTEAQRMNGQTEKQKASLSLGRRKGVNNLTGIPKSEASKRKRSKTMKAWCAANPDKVAARGEKIRGDKNYNWKGGVTRLNKSIRQMHEHRKWMDGVKARDNYSCVSCGSDEKLESHHVEGFAVLLNRHDVKNRDDARNTPELWDIGNGVTLCQKCHYLEHGRKYDN